MCPTLAKKEIRMKTEKRGNFSVTGPRGISLMGFLTRKPQGEIIVTPNTTPIGKR